MNRYFELRVIPSIEDVCNAAVDIFSDLLNAKGKNIFIVPGGKTPRLFYRILARQVRNWRGVTLVLSDERLVEEDSHQSNTGMVRRELLNSIRIILLPKLVPFVNGFHPQKSEEILSAVNSLTAHLLSPRAAFLGIGADGHVASLFPGVEYESCNDEPFILVNRPEEPFLRISATTLMLSEALLVVFLVSGKSKRPVIERLLDWPKDLEPLPIQKIIHNAKGQAIVLCDQDAATN